MGDSLHHDIRGANSAGISNLFIMGGIHGDELGVGAGIVNNDDLLSHEELQSYFETVAKGEKGKDMPIIPTHVAPFFKF